MKYYKIYKKGKLINQLVGYGYSENIPEDDNFVYEKITKNQYEKLIENISKL